MGNIGLIIEVLYKGKELSNKAAWKNAQLLTGFFLILIQAVDTFLPGISISTMDSHTIANGLTAIGLLFGSYTTVATSTSVGVGK
jgi:hypothetical protein